ERNRSGDAGGCGNELRRGKPLEFFLLQQRRSRDFGQSDEDWRHRERRQDWEEARVLKKKRRRPGEGGDAQGEETAKRDDGPMRARPRYFISRVGAHERPAEACVADISKERHYRKRQRNEAEIPRRQNSRQQRHGDEARREL